MNAVLHSLPSGRYNADHGILGKTREILVGRKSNPRGHLRKNVAPFAVWLHLLVGNSVLAGSDGVLASPDVSMVESTDPKCCGCPGTELTEAVPPCAVCIDWYTQFCERHYPKAWNHAVAYITRYTVDPASVDVQGIVENALSEGLVLLEAGAWTRPEDGKFEGYLEALLELIELSYKHHSFTGFCEDVYCRALKVARSYILRFGGNGNGSDPDDATDEAFGRAWEKLQVGEWEPYDNLAPYEGKFLGSVLKSSCGDTVKKSQRLALLGDYSDELSHKTMGNENPDPFYSLQKTEEEAALTTALQQLPPAWRKIIHLRFWNGLSVAATADASGYSMSTVVTYTRYALRRLGTILADDEIDTEGNRQNVRARYFTP